MNTERSDLSVDQARHRVLVALAERWPNVSFQVAEHATLVREFGWVFTLEVIGVKETTGATNAKVTPRLVLVNKRSAQAVGTSRSYTPERFAAVFERLLARSRANARNWCVTMDAHLDRKEASIAEAARAAGLEELAAAEDEKKFIKGR